MSKASAIEQPLMLYEGDDTPLWEKQVAWERGRRIVRGRQMQVTWKAMARALHVTPARVQQLHELYLPITESPLERYARQPHLLDAPWGF